LVIKAPDPDWIRIRIGIQPKMLDPGPDQMNTESVLQIRNPAFKVDRKGIPYAFYSSCKVHNATGFSSYRVFLKENFSSLLKASISGNFLSKMHRYQAMNKNVIFFLALTGKLSLSIFTF
jgi:hypothetical protein